MIKKSALFLVFVLVLSVLSFALSNQADECFDQASMQYLVGDLNAAFKSLEKARKLDPSNSEIKELYLTVLKELQLMQHKEKAIAQDNRLLFTHFIEKGKKSYETMDFASAVIYFKAAAGLFPDNADAAYYLKQSQEMEKKFVKGKERDLLLAQLSLFMGFFFLAVLLIPVSLKMEKQVSKEALKRRKNVCFNCGARISSSIDLCPYCGAWLGTKMYKSITTEQGLWYQKWGWRKNPFTLDIHPELFTGYRNEVKSILEKIHARSGHVLITGPLGVGKTTLLRWLVNHLAQDFFAVYVSRPPQDFSQLIKLIVQNMGLSQKHLEEYDIYHLDKLRKQGGKNLLILLDEAHEFSIDIERPLRTLGDLDEVKLIMAGLPETIEKFKAEIRPLFERIVLQVNLRSLAPEDLKELIKSRIENAGGHEIHPFSSAALDKIYELADGIPRKVVKLCDSAVTLAINEGDDKITPELVLKLNVQK